MLSTLKAKFLISFYEATLKNTDIITDVIDTACLIVKSLWCKTEIFGKNGKNGSGVAKVETGDHLSASLSDSVNYT